MAEIDKYEAMEVLTKKQEEERLRIIKNKKRNYKIGFASLGVTVIGLVAVYVLAANVWLVDLANMPYIEYEYESNQEGEKVATLTRVKPDSNYPEDFRIPAYVNGYKINAIADSAFTGCSRLKSVTMTDNIETIGEYAFAELSNLGTINFSKNITYMGTGAFDGTKFINELPDDSVTLICGILFKVGDGILDEKCVLLIDHDSVVPSGYESYKKVYFSDWSNDGEEIKVWTDGLFANNQNLVYVEIPSYLQKISAYSFYGVSNLRGVAFPDDVESFVIEDYAFYDCLSLADITINDKVASIGDYAFAFTSLGDIALPNTLSSIGTAAFMGCTEMSTFTWPSGTEDYVLSIPESAFEGCENLETFNLSENALEHMQNIGRNAFKNTKLSEFTFPKHVSSIESGVLANVEGLEDIYLYQGATNYDRFGSKETIGVSKIDYDAFVYTNLSTIALYDDEYDVVTPYGEINLPTTMAAKGFASNSSKGNQFSNNASITTFTFPYTVTDTSYEMFVNDTNLSSVTFNTYRDGYKLRGLTSLAYRTFYNCSSLTYVELPETLTYIGEGSFQESALTHIELPENSSLTTINKYAFKDCSDLNYVAIPQYFNNFKSECFANDTNLEYIYIPFRDEETIATKNYSDLTIEKDTFINMREKDEDGNFLSQMPIYLNITKAESKATNMPYDEEITVGSKRWHDDSCKVYWKGEWELDAFGVPQPIE